MARNDLTAAELISQLEDYETSWSQWEVDFILNMQQKLENDEKLSDKQLEKLRELHSKYCK